MEMNGRGWAILRGLMGTSAIALIGYVAYRYSIYNPPRHGSLYATIFPLALPFALLALALAVRPRLLAGLAGGAGVAARAGATAFGGLWMATGAMCVAGFSKAVVEAPVEGTVNMVHLVSDHIFLPVAVVALAWVPDLVARWLGAESAESAGERHPAPTTVAG